MILSTHYSHIKSDGLMREVRTIWEEEAAERNAQEGNQYCDSNKDDNCDVTINYNCGYYVMVFVR